jgi:hypothetical protein
MKGVNLDVELLTNQRIHGILTRAAHERLAAKASLYNARPFTSGNDRSSARLRRQNLSRLKPMVTSGASAA